MAAQPQPSNYRNHRYQQQNFKQPIAEISKWSYLETPCRSRGLFRHLAIFSDTAAHRH
jgi:hypothetical protein